MSPRGLIAILAVVVVGGAVGGAVVAAPGLLKPRVEAALSAATGHEVTIRGGLRLGWGPGLVVRASDVAVANPPWASRPDLATIPLVSVSADLSGLLGGAVKIASVDLQAPDVLLETDPAGHGNWERPANAASPTPAPRSSPAGPPSSWRVEMGRVSFAAAKLAYRDAKGARTDATADGSADLASASVPVKLTLRGVQGEVHAEGTVDRADPIRHSTLDVTARLTLPETIDVAGKLTPGEAGPAFTLNGLGLGLEAAASGMIAAATLRPAGPMVVDAKAASLAGLARFGVPPAAGPFTLHAAITPDGGAFQVRDLNLTLPAGSVTGSLDVTPAQPPSIRGSLASASLDLDKLLAGFAPSASATPPASAPASAPASPAVPAAGAAPQPALPWMLLQRANADLQVAVAALRSGGVTIQDLSGHLVLQDGRLSLDPLAGVGPGGRAQLVVHADSRAAPPTMALVLHAPALALQPLVILAGLPGEVTGAAAIELDLRAAGQTQPELLRTLAGRASARLADGDLDLHVLDALLAQAKLPVDLRGRAHLRCLVVGADIARGVASLSSLVIDASRIAIQGGGSVDLAQRTMALRLRPLLRTGPGLVVPVTVTGPWGKPKLDIDRGDVGGALAALTGQAAGDPCHAAGVNSTAALPAAKPLKPAELLRSLLR